MKFPRHLFLLLLFVWSALPVLHAQVNNVRIAIPDSLNRKLQGNLSSAERIETLNGLADYWRDKDAVRSLAAADEALLLARKMNDKLHLAMARFSRGNALLSLRWQDSAEQEYIAAKQLLAGLPGKKAVRCMAHIWSNYGIVQQLRGDNRQYLDILLNKVVTLSEQAGDSAALGSTYCNIGMLFMNFGEYDKALYYLRLVTGRYKHFITGNTLASAYLYNAEINLYRKPPDFPLAADYLQQARSVLAQDTTSHIRILYYVMLGAYYFFQEDYPKSLQCYDSGWVLEQRWQLGYDAANLLLGKADAYYQMHQPEQARKTMYDLYHFTQAHHVTLDRQLYLKNIALLEAETGHYDTAYRTLAEYVSLSDSANMIKAKVAMAALEKKYRYEKKEAEVRQLQHNSRLSRYVAYLSVTAIILLLILLFLAHSRYRSRKRSAEQQAALLEQKIKHQEQQQQIEVANALLEGEERERRRLASDLHDGLGGMLANVKINLSDIVYHHSMISPGLDKAISQLDQSVAELRRIARNMMPGSLLRSGLETALTDLCIMASTGKLKVDFQMIDIPAAAPEQAQVIIYRIVQELIANVIRHAHATEVFVQCSQTGNLFCITVEDNGTGIPADNGSGKKGIGLENIRNRVEFLQGNLDIVSEPGKGTTINIELYVA